MDTKLLEKKMESISPFELKNRLIDMADESLKKTARTMLNAGAATPTGLQPLHAKPSSCWEASAWKSAAASWICPRELQASPKKKALLPLRSLPEKEQ